jgi:hypothetical protein
MFKLFLLRPLPTLKTLLTRTPVEMNLGQRFFLYPEERMVVIQGIFWEITTLFCGEELVRNKPERMNIIGGGKTLVKDNLEHKTSVQEKENKMQGMA